MLFFILLRMSFRKKMQRSTDYRATIKKSILSEVEKSRKNEPAIQLHQYEARQTLCQTWMIRDDPTLKMTIFVNIHETAIFRYFAVSNRKNMKNDVSDIHKVCHHETTLYLPGREQGMTRAGP